ncbi:MAG: CotH kinase family protein [Verrucomicrobia bacterium]|nr:CotH kinase family protein [Verrucomicrobiota bacterium]
MKTLKNWRVCGGGLCILLGLAAAGHAADGEVMLSVSNNVVWLQVDGDKDDDWWLESSTNLTRWTTLTNFGTILSGNETNAPWRSVGAMAGGSAYYRAVQTAGLYDPSIFRTVSLTYTQATLTAFTNALRLGRQYDTNVYVPRVWLDNGATNHHVGARYRGNTSYLMSGRKKSINLEFDFVTPGDDLMNYETVNLNNAAGDETIIREPLYFTIMSQYTPCPKGAMARVEFNGSLWGVYSMVQQFDGQFVREWFPSNNGDRWRAPNAPVGGFTSSNSAFHYFGTTNLSSYTRHYELRNTKVDTNTAWARLINAIYVLNTAPANERRDRAEEVFAVDNWLWFLAIENLFVDDDSYWNKGADYAFYFEPESGRFHPVEHDGNEAFAAIGSVNYTLSPVQGATGNNRPLLYRLLPIPELRQRYLAHLRTVLGEYFNPGTMTPMINAFHALSITSIIADPNKNYTMGAYTNDLRALKAYVTNRYNFLKNHAELTPLQPNIEWVSGPTSPVYPTNTATLTARVVPNGNSGVGSVWLYFRDKPYGRFTVRQMFDDGAHGDAAADDGVYGTVTTNYPAGNRIHYYIEARATNAAQAASFSPPRAEHMTYNYRVGLLTAPSTPVVINEFMADNATTLADPQGDYDDWIELRNLTDAPANLTGLYLTDNAANPRKWPFPAGTTIPANGYLIVWADENGSATPGLHANFKLSKEGEEILLIDTDANHNQVLDSISFGPQATDLSFGRSSANADVWRIMSPTPGQPNE